MVMISPMAAFSDSGINNFSSGTPWYLSVLDGYIGRYFSLNSSSSETPLASASR